MEQANVKGDRVVISFKDLQALRIREQQVEYTIPNQNTDHGVKEQPTSSDGRGANANPSQAEKCHSPSQKTLLPPPAIQFYSPLDATDPSQLPPSSPASCMDSSDFFSPLSVHRYTAKEQTSFPPALSLHYSPSPAPISRLSPELSRNDLLRPSPRSMSPELSPPLPRSSSPELSPPLPRSASPELSRNEFVRPSSQPVSGEQQQPRQVRLSKKEKVIILLLTLLDEAVQSIFH